MQKNSSEPLAPAASAPLDRSTAGRRAYVEREYLAGRPTRAIERDCAALFGCARRLIRKDLTLARSRVAKAFTGETPDAVRARFEAMASRAFEVADREGDANGMLNAATRIAEVHGAYKREVKIAATVTGLAELFGPRFDGSENAAGEGDSDGDQPRADGGAGAPALG